MASVDCNKWTLLIVWVNISRFTSIDIIFQWYTKQFNGIRSGDFGGHSIFSYLSTICLEVIGHGSTKAFTSRWANPLALVGTTNGGKEMVIIVDYNK